MKRDLYYIIAIVALSALAFWLFNNWKNSQAEVSRKDSVITEKNAEIKYRVNREGEILAQKEAAVIRAKDLEDAYPKIYEDLKKEFDIKVKDLKAYIQNEFEARGTGQGSITTNNYYDSTLRRQIRFRDFEMNDGYLTFNTRLFDSLSNSLYNYVYSDTSKTAIHTKKRWLFGKEQLYATTKLSNPNAKLIGSTNVLIDTYRDKKFGVGPAIIYDPFNGNFSIGVSLTYCLFKF